MAVAAFSQPGSGDQQAARRAAGDPGEAIRHEGRALLVAHGDVAQPRLGQPAVEVEGVDPGMPKTVSTP